MRKYLVPRKGVIRVNNVIKALGSLGDQQRSSMDIQQLMVGLIRAQKRLIQVEGMRAPAAVRELSEHNVEGYRRAIAGKIIAMARTCDREDNLEAPIWSRRVARLAMAS